MNPKFSALRSFGISVLSFVISLIFGFFFILPFSEKLFTYVVMGGLFFPIIIEIFQRKKQKEERSSSDRQVQLLNDGNLSEKNYFKEYDEAVRKHREKTGSLKYFLRQISIMTLFATIAILISLVIRPFNEKLSWYIFVGGIFIPMAVYFIFETGKMLMRCKLYWNGMWAATFPEQEDKK